MERTDLDIYKELAAKYLKERNYFEELNRTARLEADGYFNIIEQAQKDSEKTSGLVDELVEYARHKGWCNIAKCAPVEYTGQDATKLACNCGWNKLKQALAKAKQAKSGA